MSIRCIRPTARNVLERLRIAGWIWSRCTPPPNLRKSMEMPAGSVRLTSDQEQAGRLQTETVQSAPAAHTVRTAGRVVPDESRTYRVSAGVDGWVRRVFSDRTGTQVKRGEALAAFYSKDISAPQQAYVYALESYERLKQASISSRRSLSPWLRSNSRRHAITSNSSAWARGRWKS